ncbi:MAG: hypothetical protein ABIJ09_17190 [Pseudomonadota bacterium]
MRIVHRLTIVGLSGLLLVAAACDRQADASASPSSTASAPTAAAAVTPIARVVFVDQEEACACTRERIDLSWTALQASLGTPARYPVERIHLDSQAAQAEVYLKAKPLMVPPGLYFVDAQGAVLEQLEGELTADQIAAVLSAH